MPRALCLFLTVFPLSLFAAGHDLSISPPTGHQILPVVTGNGSGFTAAWIQLAPPGQNAVVSQTVSAGGEPIAGAGTASDQPPVFSMAIAHSPSDALLAWIIDSDLFAKRLSPAGMELSTTLVTFGKGSRSGVAVAWNGSRYFVVWSTEAELMGAFVAADGSSTIPRPFFSEPLANGHDPTELTAAPELAWDGQHFIVVFAEVPNIPCTTLCSSPSPDHFRVMRVSADGDAINNSPLTISGTHLRAHVASSGADSLIVLDGRGEVSAVIAHDDESGLTLNAETPLFRWFTEVWSDVVWDGAMYTAGWRYAGADLSWIGAAHVTRSGLPLDYRMLATGTLRSAWWGRPSIAVNEAGVTAFAVSEGAGLSSIDGARLYLASELAPMPAPPPAPKNVVSYFSGNTARIDWQSDDATGGFVIEWWSPLDQAWHFYRTVLSDARTTTVYASVGNLFRVRAFASAASSGIAPATEKKRAVGSDTLPTARLLSLIQHASGGRRPACPSAVQCRQEASGIHAPEREKLIIR
jgi:hypothetical protein